MAMNDEAKHTPGEWGYTYDDDGAEMGEPYAVDLVARRKPGLCVPIAKIINQNAAEANARLIAAAPGLLAACELAFAIEDSTTQAHERLLRDGYADKLRAAIAKAKGTK